MAQAKADVEQQQAEVIRAQAEYDRQVRLAKQNATSAADVEPGRRSAIRPRRRSTRPRPISSWRRSISATPRSRRPSTDGCRRISSTWAPWSVPARPPSSRASSSSSPSTSTSTSTSWRSCASSRPLSRKGGRRSDLARNIPVEAGLQSETGYPHKGRLDYIAPGIDPSTGTLMVRGIFTNEDQAFLPGMFVRVRVPLARARQRAYSSMTGRSARDQGGPYLLLVDADDKVVQRPVQIGDARRRPACDPAGGRDRTTE